LQQNGTRDLSCGVEWGMMDLYSKSRITESEASILLKAADIIVNANGAARNWTDKQIAMRKLFEHAVIKAHVIGYGGKV
jgi:hypothetical protein